MKIKRLICFVLCTLLLVGCSSSNTENTDVAEPASAQNNELIERTVYAMDTVMSLKAYGENAEKALDEAEKQILKLDSALDRNDTNGEIYVLNTSGRAELSEGTAHLLGRALEICESTDGAFDISIAPVMDLWGFYTKDYYVPTDAEISAVLENVDYKNISVSDNSAVCENGACVDLGGIAKGYASELVLNIFKDNGVSGIISLGGNVVAVGNKPDSSPWRVAIQDPDDEASFAGGLSATDMAVITSGAYQRFFEQDSKIYHHIIDPFTGYPAESGLKSVTIVSDDATMADGLSTALFVMGLEKGTQYWREHDGFDVVFITDDNSLYITEGLVDSFESERQYSVIAKQ